MNKENEIKNKSYSVLDTESLLIHNDERPKINLQTPHRNLAGRAQAEKSAVWHDGKGKHGFPHPLSFRKVSMRNIGAALYPAYRHCGMTNAARGFTLIELLVVVLIIGILAAVAVPQYQKAVDYTRVKMLFLTMQAIRQAENLYKIENGSYTLNFEELALDLPIKSISQEKRDITLLDGRQYSLGYSSGSWHVVGGMSSPSIAIYAAFSNEIWLCYPRGKERSKRICKMLGCAANKLDDQYCSFKP